MKILHVNGNYNRQGGVQQYILSVGRLLADHGHSNVIIYTEQSALTIRDGTWPAYHIQTGKDIAIQVENVLDVERPDAAYIHHDSSSALIELLASRLPSVAYVHGFSAVCPGLGKFFRRGDQVCEQPFGWGCVPMHYIRRCSAARHPGTLARMMRNTAALKAALLKLPRFLVGSGYMADLLVQNCFPAEKIAVLPPHFLPDDISLIYTPPEEPQTVLFAGRLEIEKGFPYMLQAMAELPYDMRLEVAGDGTLWSSYEEMARDLGLEERIDFLGWLDSAAMEKAYQRCSLVAIPSICPESFGKTGVEALAYGRPVVASDVGGISDWLDDGVNGFLVRSKDVMGLASRIGQLLGDESLRIQLGQAGQAGVGRQYSSNQHLAILLATIESAEIEYE